MGLCKVDGGSPGASSSIDSATAASPPLCARSPSSAAHQRAAGEVLRAHDDVLQQRGAQRLGIVPQQRELAHSQHPGAAGKGGQAKWVWKCCQSKLSCSVTPGTFVLLASPLLLKAAQ